MRKSGLIAIVIIVLLAAIGCGGEECRPHRWKLPPGAGSPPVAGGDSSKL